MVDKLDKFHKTILGYTLFMVVELALTYAFASLAIDTGNLLWYALTLLFLVGSLQNIVQLIGKIIRPRNVRKTQR